MKRKIWLEYFFTLALAIGAALFVRTNILTAYKVPTGSMQPALKPGDFVFASRTSYGLRLFGSSGAMMLSDPQRGDLVVFSYPNQPSVSFVKRIIALPGDRIEIKDNRLILNNKAVQYVIEDSAQENPNASLFSIYREKIENLNWRVIFEKKESHKNFGPLVVPTGEVFLLGDNRDASDDSRYWGTVPSSQITGKVVFIWLSMDWQNKWGGGRFPRVRWERVFSSVD